MIFFFFVCAAFSTVLVYHTSDSKFCPLQCASSEPRLHASYLVHRLLYSCPPQSKRRPMKEGQMGCADERATTNDNDPYLSY